VGGLSIFSFFVFTKILVAEIKIYRYFVG